MTARTDHPTPRSFSTGPWEVRIERDGVRVYSPAGPIAEMLSGQQGMREANAALVASAPDLLAERDALRERVRTLREAIKPFAEISLIPPGREDYIQTPYEVDANDVTTARAALASTEAEVKP